MPAYKAQASKTSLFILTSFFTVVQAVAYSNDLLDVYSQAEQNNIQLKASLTDYRIIQEQQTEIASEYAPSLSLKLQPGYSFGGKKNLDRTGLDYAFSLTKPIYQQQLNAQISQAKSTVHRQQVAFDYERQQLIAQLATAYLNFTAAQNRLRLSLAEQAIVRDNLNQLNSLYNAQLTTITEVSETQLQLEQSDFTISTANLELNNARKELHLLSGVSYSALAELNEHQPLPSLQPSQLEGWIKLANAHSHELLLARFDLQIQKKGIRIERSANSTSVDLFASYEGESSSGEGNAVQEDRGGKVGLELNIPLYSGGRNASKVRSASLQHQKTQYALDLKRREVAQNVQLGYLTVKASIRNLQTMQNSVHKSEAILSNVRRGRAAGLQTMADVLSYSQKSILVKRSYADAKYKLLTDLINLRLSAGVLSANDLMTINSLLTPNHRSTMWTETSSIESSFTEAENKGLTLEDAWSLN